MKRWAWLLALFLVILPATVRADGGATLYTVYESGQLLFTFAGDMDVGDEYIAADNSQYEIIAVDEGAGRAEARYLGVVTLPEPAEREVFAVAVSSGTSAKRVIALYSTHTSESYKPTDGTDSAGNGVGGIVDVDNALKAALEENGVQVVLDTTSHAPHDAGAYRRSRQTAVQLIKNSPDALIDVHRDGIPDPAEYKVTIDGEPVSKIRLLVGKQNQNQAANRAFALSLKSTADKQYKGLIKDIYIGKGSYNQDLMSNAILLEIGTHTLDKSRAVASTQLMANVITDTLYGASSGAAPGGTQKDADAGAWSGVLWVALFVIVGTVTFAFLQTGRGKVAFEKIGRGVSEMTAGVLGKKAKRER